MVEKFSCHSLNSLKNLHLIKNTIKRYKNTARLNTQHTGGVEGFAMMLFIPPILALIFNSTLVIVGTLHSLTVDTCTHWVITPTSISPTFLSGPVERDRAIDSHLPCHF